MCRDLRQRLCLSSSAPWGADVRARFPVDSGLASATLLADLVEPLQAQREPRHPKPASVTGCSPAFELNFTCAGRVALATFSNFVAAPRDRL